MNILDIDLNELVSKEVSEKIEGLEKQLQKSYEENRKLAKQVDELKLRGKDAKITNSLLDHIRTSFLAIEADKPDKDGWFDSKQKKQFLFVEKVLLNLFGIAKEQNGWYCSRHDGSLSVHLAVNFYKNKQTVIDLLTVIKADSAKEINFIKAFQMPYDYPLQDVLNYVKAPKYNTNGCIFGIGQYWIEYGAGLQNMPHNLIMQNPLILTPDVFKVLLDTAKSGQGESHYLFSLPVYNKDISEAQVKQLGECLLSVPPKWLTYDDFKRFLSDNLTRFNNKTLDYLYGLMTADNQYKTLHWENFPQEYQHRFLKSQPFEDILKIITGYSCKWTVEQKELFLKEYTNKQ